MVFKIERLYSQLSNCLVVHLWPKCQALLTAVKQDYETQATAGSL